MKNETNYSESANLHVGHRKRLYSLGEKAGLENLSEIQVLELLLTMVIPRKDTNIIAHDLLKEFGSFSAVLDASPIDLKKVKGIGESASKLISLFPQFFFYYRQDKLKKKTKIYSYKDMEEYVTNLLDSKPKEELYLIALAANGDVISYTKLSIGSRCRVEVNPKAVSEFVVKFDAHSIIMGHSHPDSVAVPSIEDINATSVINKILSVLGVKLLDHIIVGKNSTYSFSRNNMLA